MSRYRVLIVEPNLELCHVLGGYLEKSQLEILEETNAAQALQTARRERPDVIACEKTLPGAKDGLELVRKLRAEADFRITPILLLSEAIAPEERLDAFDAGADDLILKPFSMRELGYRIDRLVRTQPGQLSGDLSRFKSTDILQMLEANQATGVLHISGEQNGEIHLLDGYICGGFANGITGEEAAYRLIPVRRGRFHFARANIRSNIGSVRSTTEFMMEALRRHDESEKQPTN